MKNILATVIVGFIAGLTISGILFDAISYVGKSFNRISVAWDVSKAEKCFADGRFPDAVFLYEKALTKVRTDNKTLVAKIKNNLALSIFKEYQNGKDENDLDKVLVLLHEAEAIYLEIDNRELAEQTNKNIKIILESHGPDRR